MWSTLMGLSLVVTGCRPTGDLSCSRDKDCLESEICHPDEGRCAILCVTNADCPATAPSCAAISDVHTTKICKCMTETCP
ncbi:hypothetical protein MEBOL_000519 [Melittangium boletus DSM 14713]|uniref:Uncharacterized protein n=1 Tax=Melittangium boletus DSM 14713 TaxID=1294270 RepID=A0A286NVC9_9BACT|nr:hypothetical protein MEBOL_000519 [Melittangium boletus DSM 14713]